MEQLITYEFAFVVPSVVFPFSLSVVVTLCILRCLFSQKNIKASRSNIPIGTAILIPRTVTFDAT
jgi:predicted Kef-type K+ transport protein